MSVRLQLFEQTDPKGALVLVAFHSTGGAAPIAAAFLQQHLDLPLVGHIEVDELGPVVQVSNGLATSPVRILGAAVQCNLGTPCDRLYVILAELPVPAVLADDIAQAILEWAKDATYVLCLDAVVREDGDGEPDVYMLADRKEALERLGASQAQPLGGGIIVGMTAALLGRGRNGGVNVGALVVEAARSHPDGRAAAKLVQALDPLLPTVRIDPGPLMQEAAELEERIGRALREAEQAQPKRPLHTFI